VETAALGEVAQELDAAVAGTLFSGDYKGGFGYGLAAPDSRFELAVKGAYQRLTPVPASVFTVVGGVRLNSAAGPRLADAFYLDAMVGAAQAHTVAANPLALALGAEIGKRFRLSEQVSFTPSLGFLRFANPAGPGYSLVLAFAPVGLSVLF
jgi:hypothetical protein